MKKHLILPFLLFFSSISIADVIQKIDLEYRDAATIHGLLETLFEGDIAIAVDGNSLLFRGEDADVKALLTMIKRLDKPQQSIRIGLYRGVDPYRGRVNENSHQTATTYPHQKNILEQWIMEDGAKMVVRENITVLEQQEQLLLKIGDQDEKSVLTANTRSEEERTKQHSIRITLTDKQQSARIVVKTQVANRAATGGGDELISTGVESRRMIPTGQWVRLFYRQNQANTFTPESRATASTDLNFKDEQALWIMVEPI